jgi:hypothetical protein
MDSYQIEIIEKFKNFRPSPTYPIYPPYHKGLYLEDAFFEWFISNNVQLERYYIPVFWTTCYIQNSQHGVQQILNNLDRTKKYFTISQHDDAIIEILPSDTICFNAGGNRSGIPIPLICSPIELKPKLNKDIFCSFVGSVTHPIRYSIFNVLKDNCKYYFSNKNWTPSVDISDFEKFIEITSRSVFCLCPRGYGKSSFRLYECMQLGTIPVYVYDDKWIPFEDTIDWSKFSVLIHVSDINNIDSILSSYTNDKINEMQENIYYYWSNNFTMESTFNKIKKIINE